MQSMDIETLPQVQNDRVQPTQPEKIDSELDIQRGIISGLIKKVDSSLLTDQQSTMGNSHQATIEALRRQLEFYFGDPNLYKNDHMRKLVTANPKGYVDLKTLLSFNRIAQILNNSHIVKYEEKLNALRQAVSTSLLLKICKQSLRAKRRVRFEPDVLKKPEYAAEIDCRTIYVENIPIQANHEVIAQVFQKYGHILLVNLPKEAEGKVHKNKGFVFIEFGVLFGVIVD